VQEASQRLAIVVLGLLGHAGIRCPIEAVIRPRIHVKLDRHPGAAQSIRISHVFFEEQIKTADRNVGWRQARHIRCSCSRRIRRSNIRAASPPPASPVSPKPAGPGYCCGRRHYSCWCSRSPRAEASYLVIWVSLVAIIGRFFVMALIEPLGRRGSGVLCCLVAAVAISVAGHMADVYIGAASMFFVMILVTAFFGSGNYSIVGPYMAEVWPTRLRTSGMGLGYGIGNMGKIIGPLGLALIAGSSDYISPKATLDALGPAFLYFGSWWILGAIAFWFIGFETKGRTFEEMDSTLAKSAASLQRVPAA